MFVQVVDFHRAFNLPIATTPTLPAQAGRVLRQDLLAEELQEFCQAYHSNDLVEMADGLADMCYIIAGTCVVYGIVPEMIPDVLSASLLTKPDEMPNLDDLLAEDFAAYQQAERMDDLDAIRIRLWTMMVDVHGCALTLGVPLTEVFDEVHRSNMSKLLPDGTVIRREDGKVLKPQSWEAPKIAEILAEHGVLTC